MRNLFIILCVLGALLALKFLFFPSYAGERKPGGANSKGQPASVTAKIIRPEPLNNRIFIIGTLLASREVEVAPERAGKVTQIFFREGKRVVKDQLLVKLNDAVLQAQLRKLKVQEKLALETEARQQKLLAINAISQQDYDNTLSQLNALKADIELVQAQISESEIRAPFDGTAGLSTLAEGSYITPSQSVLSIQQTDPVKIEFFVPEKYTGQVAPGDTLLFSTENLTGSHKAVITAVEAKMDLSTRTLLVHAETSNRDGKLIPGSAAKIELLLGNNQSAIMAPTEAIIPVLKGKKVFLFRSGKAEEVMIQSGIRTDEKIQVISGIAAGDTLIISGIMQLKPGSPVKIVSLK